jgi:hypothetical protein
MKFELSEVWCRIAIAALTRDAEEFEREARQLEPFARKNARMPKLAAKQRAEIEDLYRKAEAKWAAAQWWAERWAELEEKKSA